MNAVEFLLASFDDIWNHRWESTMSALNGVASDEAAWQHPAYRDVVPETGYPLPGTVLWHLAHLEYCTRSYTAVLRLRPVADNSGVDPPVLLSADPLLPSLLDLLRSARAEFRRELALLNDADLDGPCRPGVSVAEFLRMVLRHESWHGGQIALLRRLYREREVEPNCGEVAAGQQLLCSATHRFSVDVRDSAVTCLHLPKRRN